MCIVQYRVAIPLYMPHLPNDGVVLCFLVARDSTVSCCSSKISFGNVYVLVNGLFLWSKLL